MSHSRTSPGATKRSARAFTRLVYPARYRGNAAGSRPFGNGVCPAREPGKQHFVLAVRPVARLCLPTPQGEFDAHAFECPSGFVYLALVKGKIADGTSVLTRVHSECLTGDALGSLRCDCGTQLQLALRAIAAEGRGVLVYATGHEGRGIGLVNKLRAYMEQEKGIDTLDANLHLGLPADARRYSEAAAVLQAIGVAGVRLLSNNPDKASGLAAAGIRVESLEPLVTAPHARNVDYLRTKRRRMGHLGTTGNGLAQLPDLPVDVTRLLGTFVDPEWRPYVVLKYAQTLDGRIASSSGDSKWISGEPERRISHALRATCDAVMVGVGTVLRDDPQLTVRLVPGPSPLRVVLDSTLRTPISARVLGDDAATVILTSQPIALAKRRALALRNVAVRAVRPSPQGIDLAAALGVLRSTGVRSLLVEGGARLITSLLAAGLVDRLVVAVAPRILGSGTDAVGDLRVHRVAGSLSLTNRSFHPVGDDLLVACDVAGPVAAEPAPRDSISVAGESNGKHTGVVELPARYAAE